ncbi:hypothetical protein Patl1_18389 [Pistacia atlantica]|uniref:Uncharacterized protein n=1 Tax=Pistacia atlantica TaxID=434234 RepID=A0ACC1BYV8_9ROSI|nr:hypothetical protein Patl1_18389 [Pistacia atlantica]
MQHGRYWMILSSNFQNLLLEYQSIY